MPSVSERQRRFFAMAHKDPEFAKKVGIDPKVAKEFYEADEALTEEEREAIYKEQAQKKLADLGETTSAESFMELIEFGSALESLLNQGKLLLSIESLTDSAVSDYKEIANQVLAPAGLTVDIPGTISGVDPNTDLEVTVEAIYHYGLMTQDAIHRSVGLESKNKAALENFQTMFGDPFKESANVPAVAGASAVTLNPFTRDLSQYPDANAIRWIEARKNLDSIAILLNSIPNIPAGKLSGDEFNALKRLVKATMCNIGFYVDEVDYANDLIQLSEVLGRATQIVNAKIQATWKPGMPGYGIENLNIDEFDKEHYGFFSKEAVMAMFGDLPRKKTSDASLPLLDDPVS